MKYSKLDNAKAHCNFQEIIIVMGDLNFRIGNERDGKTVGKSRLGTPNECREKWVQWCTVNTR